MRLCSFREQNKISVGILPGTELVDFLTINQVLGASFPNSVSELIQYSQLDELRRWFIRHADRLRGAGRDLAGLTFTLPYRNPPKLWGIGLNYAEHASDLAEKSPDEAASFMKPATTMIGPGEPVSLPADSECVTGEAELTVVIGRQCKFISREEAPSVIAGFLLEIDMTAEDILRANLRFLNRAKSFVPRSDMCRRARDLRQSVVDADNRGYMMKAGLLSTLGALTIAYLIVWYLAGRNAQATDRNDPEKAKHVTTPVQVFIGLLTNFFDTLGIGSFATTSSIFKLFQIVPDELIPGTLNVGHALPTIVEAFIFISIVRVDVRTLLCMIAASIAGAWFGAGIVTQWPQRKIRIGLGLSLVGAALLMLASQWNLFPIGSDREGLEGTRLVLGVLGNLLLGALMPLGIGLYAPCMILVSLLGMNPKSAFPIMMGSCAFLMPVESVRFIRSRRYRMDAAIGLLLGGIPGVLLAAFLVKSLPLSVVRWLVVVVVLYTAAMMLRSAHVEARGRVTAQRET